MNASDDDDVDGDGDFVVDQLPDTDDGSSEEEEEGDTDEENPSGDEVEADPQWEAGLQCVLKLRGSTSSALLCGTAPPCVT